MWIAVVTMLAGSLLIVGVGVRAQRGTLPRNRLVGIRVRQTLDDDQSWHSAHQAAGSTLVATGWAAAALTVVAGVIGVVAGETAAAAALIIAVVVLVMGALLAARQGLRAIS